MKKPCKKCGGKMYQMAGRVGTPQERELANATAQRLAAKYNLMDPMNVTIGKYLPDYVDPSGRPASPMPARQLPTRLPQGYTLDDIQNYGDDYGYEDKHTGDWTPIDPSAVHHYRTLRPSPLTPFPASQAPMFAGVKQSFQPGGPFRGLQNEWDYPYNDDILRQQIAKMQQEGKLDPYEMQARFDRENNPMEARTLMKTPPPNLSIGPRPVPSNKLPEFQEPPQKKGFNWQNLGINMMKARNVLAEISGRVERGRQNQQDYENFAAIGQQTDDYRDFQPTPYQLYAQYGGRLKDYQGGGSVYDYMESQGMDGSYANRKRLFNDMFQGKYRGTAEQNMQILNMLRNQQAGTSVRRTEVPVERQQVAPVVPGQITDASQFAPPRSTGRPARRVVQPTPTPVAAPVHRKAAPAGRAVAGVEVDTGVDNATASGSAGSGVLTPAKASGLSGFANERQKFFAKQAAMANNGRFVMTDKATNQTYYGTYDAKTDTFDMNNFEVLSGANRKGTRTSKYSLAQMENLSPEQRFKEKVTPLGFFDMKRGTVYGSPALDLDAPGAIDPNIAYHVTYEGADDRTRAKRYGNKNKADNYISYGCINCQKPSIEALTQFVGDSGMKSLIIDSDRHYKENADIMKQNTPYSYSSLNLGFKKGGNWIPKDLKKGRCTPAPNPDCPVGSPQYNLAMTFKKHHGFHKQK